MTGSTLLLTATDVAGLLDLPSCIDVVEEGFRRHDRGLTTGPHALGLTLAAGSFHVKAAALSDDGRSFIAAKANVNLPGNPSRAGRPTIQGVLILCDGDDGRPLAVMDSAVITSRRTAATAAVAARHLALPEVQTATIVGCGEQGDIQARALASVRPLCTIFAVDTDADKAAAYARRLSAALGITVTPTDDLDAAVRQSQVCITCTTSTRAILGPEHLHPGLFIAAVGADNPHKQEIDPRALAASRVVVDSLDACAAGGDLHHAIAAGLMTTSDVVAEISAIVSGRHPGRTAPDDVFVFDSTGTAIQDVAAAVFVYRQALASGLGLALNLGPQ